MQGFSSAALHGGPGASLAAVGLVALLCVLLAQSLGSIGYAARADEGYYVAYVRAVRRDGAAGLPNLFRRYVEEEAYHIHPNPLRLGYIAAAVGLSAAWGTSFRALSGLSIVSHLALVGATFALSKRRLGPGRSLALASLVGASPLGLGLARRALADSFATLWIGLSLWLLLDAVLSRRRGPAAAFVASFSLAILSKESSVLLLVPFAGFVALHAAARPGEVRPVRAALLLALPPVLCLAVWVAAAGGPRPFLDVVRIILATPSTNDYALRYGGGSWNRYAIDFLLLSPWTAVLALGGLVLTAARAGDGYDPLHALFAVAVPLSLLAFEPFTKNVRYVAFLDLPIRFLALVALEGIASALRGAAARACLGVSVAAICLADLISFRAIFVEGGLYDPVTAALLQARDLVVGAWP